MPPSSATCRRRSNDGDIFWGAAGLRSTAATPAFVRQSRVRVPRQLVFVSEQRGLVWSGLVWSGLVWSGLVWSGLCETCEEPTAVLR